MCAAIQSLDAPDRAPQPPQPQLCSSNVGSPSSATSNSEPSTPPIHASQHSPLRDSDESAGSSVIASLAAHGIRVRDFAYENTLPPVTSVPRFSVQVQPRPRTLKRTRDMLECREDGEESDEEDPNISRTFYIDSNGTGTTHGSRYRKKNTALERTLTEPADDVPPPSQGFNTRAHVFPQPSQRAQDHHLLPTTPRRPTSQLSTRNLSPLQAISQSQASAQGESQESEPWIDTPIVTPNGSLQWPIQNTSALTASQLESMLPQLPDEDVTMSQLGFSPERSQHQQHPVHSPSTNSPSRPPAHPSLPPPAKFRTRESPHPRCTTPSPSPSAGRASRSDTTSPVPTPPMQEAAAAAPRYDLRQRPQSAQPQAPPPRATSRSRASGHAAARKEKPAPPAKKRKVTPPPPSMTAVKGRRKNGDNKESR